jgi:hypothetical protein
MPSGSTTRQSRRRSGQRPARAARSQSGDRCPIVPAGGTGRDRHVRHMRASVVLTTASSTLVLATVLATLQPAAAPGTTTRPGRNSASPFGIAGGGSAGERRHSRSSSVQCGLSPRAKKRARKPRGIEDCRARAPPCARRKIGPSQSLRDAHGRGGANRARERVCHVDRSLCATHVIYSPARDERERPARMAPAARSSAAVTRVE